MINAEYKSAYQQGYSDAMRDFRKSQNMSSTGRKRGAGMKAKTLYTCEICHTDYADKETAKKCERAHQTEVKGSKMFFKPIHMGNGAYPYKLEVEFADGHKITYRT